MSARKNKKKTSGKRAVLWAIIALLVVILAAALLLGWGLLQTEEPEPTVPAAAAEPTDTAAAPTIPVEEIVLDTDNFETVDLERGLQITDLGKYTGIFMEDGTDEVVSGILMLVVKNAGLDTIQYAEISLPTENGDAQFSLSTLPAGESVVLLEQTRMAYTGNEDATQATVSNVAAFSQPLSLCQEQVSIQPLDGVINVTNISGQDITGDVVIYYKNAASDLYYGGITYRVRIEGGIKADEIKQITADHFDQTGSKIMFVTVG